MSSDNEGPFMPADPQQTHALLDYRLTMIERTMVSISESLKQLANLEQKHAETREAIGRAFAEIAEQGKRIRDMEMEMPTLKLIRGWNVAAVIGVFGLLGVQLFKIALGH